MKIWKYELKPTEMQTINMPKGARVLCVQAQRGSACIWAVVDQESDKEERTFITKCTNEDFPEWLNKRNVQLAHPDYIGTFQLEAGSLVFHVFEMV